MRRAQRQSAAVWAAAQTAGAAPSATASEKTAAKQSSGSGGTSSAKALTERSVNLRMGNVGTTESRIAFELSPCWLILHAGLVRSDERRRVDRREADRTEHGGHGNGRRGIRKNTRRSRPAENPQPQKYCGVG